MASILDKDKEYPNEGLEALAKEAPEVVEKMGFNYQDRDWETNQ